MTPLLQRTQFIAGLWDAMRAAHGPLTCAEAVAKFDEGAADHDRKHAAEWREHCAFNFMRLPRALQKAIKFAIRE